jgi:2-polyprenyl-3-methyl-5-hydroxy-6-metoxy-1,4-benzoquinol methylase
VLTQNAHLLPATGCALDLACGLGANALFMAQRGLSVSAWDISPVAIDRLRQVAAQHHLSLQLEVRDVMSQPPALEQFDVIVVTRFLERQLASPLMEALKPGGLLFYQTFITDKVSDRGPDHCAYRLARNELLTLFSWLRILVYREEGLVGTVQQGFRDEALLVGQKTEC